MCSHSHSHVLCWNGFKNEMQRSDFQDLLPFLYFCALGKYISSILRPIIVHHCEAKKPKEKVKNIDLENYIFFQSLFKGKLKKIRFSIIPKRH